MPHDDVDWSGLLSGRRLPYDPRPALEAWRRGDTDNAPAELWDALHHQGDVDSASYAAAPLIAEIVANAPAPDWNAYALLATIEEARVSGRNPPVPAFLEHGYHAAWSVVFTHALRDIVTAKDSTTVRSILAVLAHAKGEHTLGEFALCTDDERQAMLAHN
jgi:hypothetical protein